MAAARLSYVELHCHSNYSLLDGASHPEELVLRARALGYEALALTDHDNLYGAMQFAQYAKAWGLRPITGAEVTLAGGYHLTLLCASRRGYAHLCRLLTHAHLDHERLKPRVEPGVLASHAEGLIALSGCPKGEVPSLIMAGRLAEAEQAARRYREWFGAENFFIELQRNWVDGDARRNRALADVARRLGLGLVATGNVHYHVQERHRLQDVLVAIRHRATLDASHAVRRPNSTFYLRSPDEVARCFADFPEAIRTTVRIAERCQFDLTADLGYRFPDDPVPPGETADSYLRALCYRAAQERYGRLTKAIADRLEEELALVRKHGLSGFFLIHHRILELAREIAAELRGRPCRMPPGRGRGSSVSSLICYLIGLSHIDPLEHNLFLGRFLNEELGSVPDIDLDFPRDLREKLILRTYEHFGRDRVGLVASFPTYRYRSAVREVGKALGLPPAELDRLARLGEGGRAAAVGEELRRLAPARLANPLWRRFAEVVAQIADFPRHLSQHVGGMVISSQPLVELVPLERAAMPGRVLLQWDKDSVDDARFIKVDFLALGALSAVEECLELIEVHRGRRVDLSRIDLQDERVYDAICRADTMGVFQIESRAQGQSLPRTRPRNLEDLTVQVAIIRPGPVMGGAVHPYVNRRLGREPVTYDHPLLEPVLRETLGVILFQEQVLQVAMALAGFSPGQAERLRRAMSRRRSAEAMAELRQLFIQGCLQRGVSHEVAERVFGKIAAFSSYGFPKSHSAAFALLAYQSAWLRVSYPAEFLCSLLNAQPMGFYPPSVLVNDGKRHGVAILPPDVNRSRASCSVEGDAVRIGLGYVKGLSAAMAQEVEAERQRHGPFRSLFDFLERTRVTREGVENLVTCGAFDAFGLQRRELLWQLGLLYRSEGRRALVRQRRLPLSTEQDAAPLPELSAWERMAADYAALGLSPRAHPMSFLRRVLDERFVTSRALERLPDGARVRIAGLVVCRQRPQTAKGVVFLVVEDDDGLVNIVVWPKVYERYRLLVRGEPFLVVEGTLQRRDGTINVVADSLRRLSLARMAPPEARSFR